MSGKWATPRPRELPTSSADWRRLRAAVLERDQHQCQELVPAYHMPNAFTLCAAPANEVDHIERDGGNAPANLRALCRTHHARKTSAEGNAARWRFKTQRAPEAHPGLVD